MLVRVTSPYFVAGIELTFADGVCTDLRCTKAAPILRWAIGKPADELRSYFKVMKWDARIVRTSDASTAPEPPSERSQTAASETAPQPSPGHQADP